MTHPERRRHGSISLPVSSPAPPDRPPLSALFLIDFDVKAGYTISWKRALPGLELQGRVEYKSLPSGLHTVASDLVYFVHDAAHAGLGAFVNVPCDEVGARHARMMAVGVLVPLSYGRLGRAWRHAPSLEHMAAKLAKDPKAVDVLERYWQSNKAQSDAESPPANPQSRHGRGRSASDGLALFQNKLSPYHPAWSLTGLLDRLGPLIFPIYRAALLRKRILISCHAPVRDMCHLVYVLSVLSNIPVSVADSLPNSSPTPRLTPLFTVGVHDIPFLADQTDVGWIACTTDSILAVKDTLWDMLITMPAQPKAWPYVECPRGSAVKATQRDLRRYNALRAGLARLAVPPDSPRASETTASGHRLVRDDEPLDQVVEPPSWASLAYNGYMWWASAGEQLRSEAHEESSRDAALLADLASPSSTTSLPDAALGDSVASLQGRHRRSRRRRSGGEETDEEARVELAIIAYFHRLTAQMLSVLDELVDDGADEMRYRDSVGGEYDGVSGRCQQDDDDDDDGQALLDSASDSDSGIPVKVTSRCVDSMGLDVWSAADAAFIRDLVAVYFGRESCVEGKGVEVCGVRVC
ncbi:hypothetical protein L249_6579 [Ophiocordyceps polyrhachis-furcata BCC 54312]|uniref:DUF4484 domain-containing protein n=1 Tax=Ophiocordyceps polyrhachis-furcata BCC 54312 TaxID=1330021 RepID=A0A367LKC0_9HYPO|nr:hypothetical protein L249_6579 [Ophiocordyceps polyrhachis-furcata BCC 54312]